MELNYQELGMKAGLEVHQQLNTKKLFCCCPSIMREDSSDFEFKRKLRAVASELGKFDPAALEAFKKKQSYLYKFYSDSNCLIELDEEPPKPINLNALKTILEVCLMTESNIVDELHVMRKTVIDGSNTSGFQRTVLVGLGGKIKLKEKEIKVQTIVLEEDAAKKIEEKDKEIIYSLDRLGIPLIELATEPDIKTPKEAKETALKIGELLRRTGKTKRGLGSIRQDVNISIAVGARVEIKGVQELEMIDVFVEKEVERQVKLIELKNELQKRNSTKEELEQESMKEVSGIFSDSKCKMIKGKKVFGIRLKKFNGLTGKELQEGKRFGTELAKYVKARTGLKGIFHSDELPKYDISKEEVEKTKEKLVCEEQDAFVLVATENQKTAEKALKTVIQRSVMALKGVPEETRNALEDGTTEYSRPLAGNARMYPETDIPARKISRKLLEELKQNLPLTSEQRKIKYINKYRISEQLAEKMKLNNYARFFEELIEKGFKATGTAVLLLEGITTLKRQGTKTENLTEKMIEETLNAVKKGKLVKDNQLKALDLWSKEPEKPIESVINSLQETRFSEEDLRKLVKETIEKNSAIINTEGTNVFSALMGEVMIKIKGKASGKEASKILREELNKKGIKE